MSSPREALMRNVWHRLVGSRGVTNLFADQLLSGTSLNTNLSSNYGKVYTSPSHEIARHRLVFLGEIHSVPPIIAFQRQVQEEMSKQSSQLHLILEHFSFDLQHLLDQFSEGRLDFDQLVEKYHEIGQEGHDLEPYRGLLEDARTKGVRIHAGFVPRSYARELIKEDPKKILQKASQWVKSPFVNLEGSEFHYNVFESLISGRSIYKIDSAPTDQFRKIFKAQVFKDAAMASKVNEIITGLSPINGDDDQRNERFLVIAGNGHFLHYCGVPERVLSENPAIAKDTCLVISASSDEDIDEKHDLHDSLKEKFGKEGSNPADYVFFYQRPEEDEDDMDAKEETKRAYDKVGESAALPGNKLKAAWIMYSLGYSEEQFNAAGPQVFNFQGVGNPHIHAKIQPGEHVLDVGSGLGIDSFIASHSTGPTGEVTGIDISPKEVKHAQQQAKERGLDKTQFLVADMESIPLPDDSVDVIISNGAFCLAPNKKKAFQELFRVLKPGGRISVCTTTTKVDGLEQGVSWPLCMQMFIAQKELQPMCEEIGFENVFVDDSDSAMSMEIPEEVLQDSNPDRNKVHVGGDDFKHLENYDMDKICARVCISAFKPQ